jgi:hypothetical protein
MPLSDWRRFWRLMESLRDNRTNFTLRSPRFSSPATWRFSPSPDKFPSDLWESAAVVEAAYGLTEELNLTAAPISMTELLQWSKPLMMARHFGTGGRRRLRISIGSVHQNAADYDRAPQEGVYVDFFDLGGQRVGFAVMTRLTCRDHGGEEIWESTKERRLEIRRIGPSEEDFAAFAEEAKALGGTARLFLGDVDDGFLRRALGDIAEF